MSIFSACSHYEFNGTLAWWLPAVRLRRGSGRLCMAMAAQQWWRGSCLISSKPAPDVASDHKTLADSEFPKKGEFPQRKNENTLGCRSFPTDSGKNKMLSTMESLLGMLSNPLESLSFISSCSRHDRSAFSTMIKSYLLFNKKQSRYRWSCYFCE